MAGDDVNNDRVEQLENSFKRLEETVQKSLQQITQTIAGLTTHENEDQPVFDVPRRPNRGRGNGRPQRQPFQQHNYGGEDSDVENEYEDEREVRGMHFGHKGAADFDYRQRAKDVPTFHGSMNVEDFMDWMSELDTFFKLYEIPMDNRVNLVAYKLKGGAQSWWKNLQTVRERQGKLPIVSWERMERELRRRFLPPNHDQILFNLLQNCAQGNRSVEVYTAEFHRLSSRNDLSETESQQVTRYINGLRPEIQDRISLVPVYTLDDAYNLAIRAENQLAKNNRSTLFPSTNRNKFVSNAGQSTSKPEGSESVQKLSTLGTGKPTGTLVSKSTSTNSYARPEKSSSTNPYARPVIGKCFKCGAPGHRSSECRATGGKINLTTREDDYDEGEEERFDEEIETDVCHPADELDGNLYTDDEYSSRVFDVVIDGDSHENFITQDIVHQLKLPTEKHPLPYNLGKFNVTECCRISFSIGKYKDEMLFDVVDMDACHIILGKPWVYDLNAIYNIEENTYKFKHNGGRFILVPLMECNHVSEPKGKNSFIMRYQDFEEEREDEFLVNSTITTTMIQDETPNKISKNLKSLEEVSQALIPDELQPILSPTQDIPLLNFSGHDIEKEHMVQNMEVIHGVKKQHVEFNCEEDDVFEFQQDVLFVLGGNSRTSFFKKGRMTQYVLV
ncbi:heterogeneous nuclear ribonucleoprotein 1 [Tanacetum coccineum]